MATDTVTKEQPNGQQPEQAKIAQFIPPKNQTRFGVVPHTFDEAWRMSVAIAKSDLAPKDFRDKPENCFIALQMGAELGIPPMAAIQNIGVINGRPVIYGDLALAIVVAHPDYEQHEEYLEGEGDKMVAVFEIQRRGHKLHKVTFSVEDAKKAKLWTKSGPWQEYPKRMLQMRARGFGLRNKFPDALKGLSIAEEAMDLPPSAPAREFPELPADIQRASEAKQEVATDMSDLAQMNKNRSEILSLCEQINHFDEKRAQELLHTGSELKTRAEEAEFIEKLHVILHELKTAAEKQQKPSGKATPPTKEQMGFDSIVRD